MKHAELIFGLSTFVFFAIAGMMTIFAYQKHKENERLKSGELDWEDEQSYW